MTDNEILIEACEKGSLYEAKRLLKPRKFIIFNLKPLANVNAEDEIGRNPLFCAAEGGKKDLVELLIAKGADVNGKNYAIPLYIAAEKGHNDVVELLIAKGADVNAVHAVYGTTPLHQAASYSHMSVVRCLLANGANKDVNDNKNRTPFDCAGHSQIIKLLENRQQMLMRLNKQLLEAAKHGKTEIVKTSIIEGADKETRDQDNMTPLHLAAENGHLDVVKYLLEIGVDKNARGDGYLTPLHGAAWHDRLAVVNCLLESGADIEAQSENQFTPLHQAAKHAGVGVVESLLAKGADKEARDIDNYTPIHWAALNGNLSVVEFLLASGADKEAKNKDDLTPLHMASYKAHHAVVDYLLAKGANKDARGKDGLTYIDLHGRYYNQARQGVRIFDARSEKEKQNENDAREGKEIPPVAQELYLLLVEARSWGRAHNWPSHYEYPQRERVREIGEQISNESGFDGMQRVAYYIDSRAGDLTSHLTQFWHGIGGWMA